MPGLVGTRSLAQETGSSLMKSNCPLCPQGCGIDLFIKGGRLTQVKGMVEDPETRGMLCALGKSLPEVVESDKRILTPLKRVGRKGSGEFSPISWEEALATIAQRWTHIIQEHGAQSIAGYLGSNVSMEASWLLPRLLFALGSPNVFLPEEQGTSAWQWAGRLTVGSFPTISFEQWDKTGCIVLWGHNPDDSSPCTIPQWVREQRKRGSKLIVVDPRKIPVAEEADEWLSIRPGTDGALAWSVAQVIITELLYDGEFVEKWTEGFTGFKEIALREEYQPESVAKQCGITPEQIQRIARLYARHSPSLILGGSGVSRHGSGLQNCRAIHSLAVLTGNVNKPGSNLYYSYPLEPATGLASLRERVEDTGVLDKQLVKLPLGYSDSTQLWDLLLGDGEDLYWKNNIFRKALSEGRVPYAYTDVYATGYGGRAYPLKSLIVLESDPLGELPHSLKGKMAFNKLAFSVVISPFVNESALYADIILPSAISPETTNMVPCHRPVSSHYLRVRKKALVPKGESKSYQSIITRLAYSMGAGKLFNFTESEFVDLLFRSSRATKTLTHEKLTSLPLPLKPLYRVRELFPHPYRKSFDTPTGKVMFSSVPLSRMGFNPYPEWSPPLEGRTRTPEFFDKYSLVLATGRRIVPESPEDGYVLINTKDAQSLGLTNELEVWIESKINKIKRKVKVSTEIAEGVVWLPYVLSLPDNKDHRGTTTVNYLVDTRNSDPICGAPRFNETLVKIYRV